MKQSNLHFPWEKRTKIVDSHIFYTEQLSATIFLTKRTVTAEIDRKIYEFTIIQNNGSKKMKNLVKEVYFEDEEINDYDLHLLFIEGYKKFKFKKMFQQDFSKKKFKLEDELELVSFVNFHLWLKNKCEEFETVQKEIEMNEVSKHIDQHFKIDPHTIEKKHLNTGDVLYDKNKLEFKHPYIYYAFDATFNGITEHFEYFLTNDELITVSNDIPSSNKFFHFHNLINDRIQWTYKSISSHNAFHKHLQSQLKQPAHLKI